MLLFGLSAPIIENLRHHLRDSTHIVQWSFGECSQELGENLAPLNQLHLRAWRERYKVDFDELSASQSPSPYRQLVELTCDRVFIDPISSNDRILYLARLETLITAEVRKITPGIAVFEATPHFPWDLLCTKVLLERGHRVFSFRPTQVDGRILVQEHLSSGRLTRLLSRDEFSNLASKQEMVVEYRCLTQGGSPNSTRMQVAHDIVSSDSLRFFLIRVVKFLLRKVTPSFFERQSPSTSC